MDTVVNSFSKATTWFRSLVTDEDSATTTLPPILRQNCRSKREELEVHSAPEISVNNTDANFSHLNKLKSVCLSSFGAANFANNRKMSEGSNLGFLANAFVNITERSESATSKELNRDELNTSSGFRFDIARQFATQQSVISGDSGIYMDNECYQAIGKQEFKTSNLSKSFRSSTASSQFNNWDQLEADNKTRKPDTLDKGTRRHLAYVDPIVRQRSNQDVNTNPTFKTERKHAGKSPTDTKAKENSKVKYNRNNNLGRIKLSLQYFSEGGQLRVIVVRADKLPAKNCDVVVRLSLSYNDVSLSESAPKVRAKCGEAQFKKDIYMEAGPDDVYEAQLCVRIFKISKFFRRKKLIGESRLSLEDLDLTMDTTLWLNLSSKHAKVCYSSTL